MQNLEIRSQKCPNSWRKELFLQKTYWTSLTKGCSELPASSEGVSVSVAPILLHINRLQDSFFTLKLEHMHIPCICFPLNLGYVQIFAKRDDWHAARCPFVIAVIKHLAKLLQSGGWDGAAGWRKNQIPLPCCRQGSVWGSDGLHRTAAAGIAICTLQSKTGETCEDHGGNYSNFNGGPVPSQIIDFLTSKLQIFHQICEISVFLLDPDPSSEGLFWFLHPSTVLLFLPTLWEFKSCKPPPA